MDSKEPPPPAKGVTLAHSKLWILIIAIADLVVVLPAMLVTIVVGLSPEEEMYGAEDAEAPSTTLRGNPTLGRAVAIWESVRILPLLANAVMLVLAINKRKPMLLVPWLAWTGVNVVASLCFVAAFFTVELGTNDIVLIAALTVVLVIGVLELPLGFSHYKVLRREVDSATSLAMSSTSYGRMA